jgi:distribution and morphology protein 31
MTTHIKHKLWSHLWDPANPFFTSKFCKRSFRPLKTPYSSTPRRAFSHNNRRPQSKFMTKTTPKKSLVSCGLFFFDISPNPSATTSAMNSCTATTEKTLYTSNILPQRPIMSIAQQLWRREMHMSSRRRERGNTRRNKSSSSNLQHGKSSNSESQKPSQAQPEPLPKKEAEPPVDPVESPATSSKYIHMPKMPHRPTKEELLGAATGFWSRLKVRFKWFSIRSVRPWNIDDWSAFVSWFVLGNIVWILVGTTTFFSLVIFSINTVVAQGMLTHKHSGCMN